VHLHVEYSDDGCEFVACIPRLSHETGVFHDIIFLINRIAAPDELRDDPRTILERGPVARS
jgi:hypothetical protein